MNLKELFPAAPFRGGFAWTLVIQRGAVDDLVTSGAYWRGHGSGGGGLEEPGERCGQVWASR